MQICNPDYCTGCAACMNVCPRNAIVFLSDNYGNLKPKIDKEKCISCKLCEKICPINSKQILYKPLRAFAAISTDSEDKKLSSSGGVASVFSRCIINSDGVVYGASCVSQKNSHIRIDSINDVSKLRGSKYVFSEIGLTYRQIKEDLENGIRVLFVSTPCQVAGLKAFLKKAYDNLITVDLICHGTPPHTYLEEHLDNKIGKGKWDTYSFRGKFNFIMTAYKDKNVVYQKASSSDEYFNSFLEGLTYNESCYNCMFARKERASEITIGDFWGIDKNTLKNKYDCRISLVLTNNEKGESFFESINSELVYEERNLEEAFNEEQGNLLHPTIAHPDRKLFLSLYPKYGFNKSVMKTSLGKKLKSEIRNKCIVFRIIIRLKRFMIKAIKKLKKSQK